MIHPLATLSFGDSGTSFRGKWIVPPTCHQNQQDLDEMNPPLRDQQPSVQVQDVPLYPG